MSIALPYEKLSYRTRARQTPFLRRQDAEISDTHKAHMGHSTMEHM